MTTLHLIRCSAFGSNVVYNCLSLLDTNDVIVLLDDGVYNLQHPVFQNMIAKVAKKNIMLISAHALARGVEFNEQCQRIELSEIVSLSLACSQSITWQ